MGELGGSQLPPHCCFVFLSAQPPLTGVPLAVWAAHLRSVGSHAHDTPSPDELTYLDGLGHRQ